MTICGVTGLRKDQPCTREKDHTDYHWHETTNGVLVFGTADRPLTDLTTGLLYQRGKASSTPGADS